MEGVEREFHIFRSFHPDTPALPIGSTGSACQKLLQDVAPKMVEAREIFKDLRDNTAYSLLMQKILPVLPPHASLAQELRWSAGKPPSFQPERHADPENLKR